MKISVKPEEACKTGDGSLSYYALSTIPLLIPINLLICLIDIPASLIFLDSAFLLLESRCWISVTSLL